MVNVTADSSSATIDDLDENKEYNVQISAATSAGNGDVSSPQIAETFRGINRYKATYSVWHNSIGDGGNGLVIGVVVLAVVVLVILVMAIAIFIR